jgi:hypothetical protein
VTLSCFVLASLGLMLTRIQGAMAKAKRGRPATGHGPTLGVRVPEAMLTAIDAIGAAAGAGRSAAVRQLLQAGLAQAGKQPREKPKRVRVEPRRP